jgi:hypothetical protein
MISYVIQDIFWPTLDTMCGWEIQEATPTPRNMSPSLRPIPNSGISGNKINTLKSNLNLNKMAVVNFAVYKVESKVFRRWCIALRITEFLDFVQRPEF